MLDDFSREMWLAGDDAMLELGFSAFEAKVKSTFAHSVPFLTDFQKMLKSLQRLANETGDPDELVEIAMIGAALGNQFTQGEGNGSVINRLVGIAAENRFIGMLDPDTKSPGFADTPAVMLEQLDRERAEILEFSKTTERILTEFSEEQMAHYLDRVRADGELEAIRWAHQRLGSGGQ